MMRDTLSRFTVLDITYSSILRWYEEIDAYSQGLHRKRTLPDSARNMGKNDVWIAATAAAVGIPLVTTDADFHHLNGVFLDLLYIDVNVYR